MRRQQVLVLSFCTLLALPLQVHGENVNTLTFLYSNTGTEAGSHTTACLYSVDGRPLTLEVTITESGGLPENSGEGSAPLEYFWEEWDGESWTATTPVAIFADTSQAQPFTRTAGEDIVRAVVRLKSSVTTSEAVVLEVDLSVTTPSSFTDSPAYGTNSGPTALISGANGPRLDLEDRFQFANDSRGWIIRRIVVMFNDNGSYQVLDLEDYATRANPQYGIGHTPPSSLLATNESITSVTVTIELIPANGEGETKTIIGSCMGDFENLQITVRDLQDLVFGEAEEE